MESRITANTFELSERVTDLHTAIQNQLDSLVEQGRERGLQVAVYLDGSQIVDAWAGLMDPSSGRKVVGETLFPVFSATKGMVSTLAHLLVERGRIDYETPIAECWPEFAAHGKEKITLRQALNHTAGLAHMPEGLSRADLGDWDHMCRAVADLRPLSPPGSEMNYHAITFGWIVGEFIHRVDGRPFPQVLQEEICQPLGLEGSLFIGLPAEKESQVARLESEIDDDTNKSLPNQATLRSIPALVRPLHVWMNHPAAWRACIPASNGIMNARALARHYAALLPGGVDGCVLLPPDRLRVAAELQRPLGWKGEDLPLRVGLGYHVGAPNSPMGSGARVFGHAGYGGSIGFADPEHRLAFALTRNRLSKENTAAAVLELLQQKLPG